jgi:hypothetical protein
MCVLGRASKMLAMSAVTTFRGAIAEGADAERLRHLASRSAAPPSKRRPPEGLVLFAEVDGEPVAAIGIADGRTVTDPNHATLALQTRLRMERIFARLVLSVWGL